MNEIMVHCQFLRRQLADINVDKLYIAFLLWMCKFFSYYI